MMAKLTKKQRGLIVNRMNNPDASKSREKRRRENSDIS